MHDTGSVTVVGQIVSILAVTCNMFHKRYCHKSVIRRCCTPAPTPVGGTHAIATTSASFGSRFRHRGIDCCRTRAGELTRHAASLPAQGYYQSAVVCIDQNNNARCDSHEETTHTDAQGRFTLSGHGNVVAEISAGKTKVYSPSTHASTTADHDLVFRAPEIVFHLAARQHSRRWPDHDGNPPSSAPCRAAIWWPRAKRSRVAWACSRSSCSEDLNAEKNTRVHDALANESALVSVHCRCGRRCPRPHDELTDTLRNRLALDEIQTIVVIYAENRSFDNLFGTFPGANGLNTNSARAIKQVDRDGKTVLSVLPPAWGGLTAAGQTPAVTQAQTTNVWPNAPFQIDSPNSAALYG